MASSQREAAFDEWPDHSQAICWLDREPEIQVGLFHLFEGTRHPAGARGEAVLAALFRSGHGTGLAHG
jgi:hypothetical protein